MKDNIQNYKMGMIAALSCASVWGFLPIYWKMLIPINSFIIILYRIILVAVLSFVLTLLFYGKKSLINPLRYPKLILYLFISGVLITANWSIYIWAVNAGAIIQTSIGYYMEPLVVCLFGVVIFREKFTKYRAFATFMAAIGVIIMIIHFRRLPGIALALAFTFGIYAAMKKAISSKFRLEPLISLFYETVFLVIPALGAVIYFEIGGRGALAAGVGKFTLLMFSGIATAIPLGLFAFAANHLPLISLGITEYIAPSIGLLLGVFLYGEPFDIVQFSAFICIWIGLIIFTIGESKLYLKREV